jgi:hypothetical protein
MSGTHFCLWTKLNSPPYRNESFPCLCFDLFLAGQETTSTTLSFLVLYLMLDQRVQAKLHADLDQIDSDDGIGLGAKPLLHYTNAVINVSKAQLNT